MAVVLPTVGRKTQIFIGATELCGWDTFDLAWNGETVDISNNCSDGFRELLDILGQQSQDVSLSGTVVDGFLRGLSNAASEVRQYPDFEVRYANGDVLAFTNMNMSTYSESNPANDKITFSVAFMSSEDWVYTAA